MTTLGASEIAIPLGLQRVRHDGFPFTSALELWGRLTGLLPRYAPLAERDTPDAELGRWYEPAVGLRYAAERELVWGRDICPGPEFGKPGLHHPSIPWLHARPDYLVNRDNLVLEVKVPRTLFEDRWGPDGTDEVPVDYYVQVAAQVAVANRLWGTEVGDLAAMARAPGWGASRTWAVYRIVRDADREQRMLDQVARWWDRHVVGGEPPDPDGSMSASEALRHMWAPVDDEVLEAGPAALEDYHKLLQVREAQREIAARRTEIEQRLQQVMGEATQLVAPSGERMVTWRVDKNGTRRFRVWGYDGGE